MKGCILVVDDEKEIADLVEFYLQSEGYEILKCYDSTQALSYIESRDIDLALLDVMMPGMDGLQLCRRIRERDNYPVIMLTAKDSEIDRITGLTIGADDYVTKPFFPLELLARVKAQLRRYERYGAKPQNASLENQKGDFKPQEDPTAGEILECGGIMLNAGAHQCFLNEEEISLTPTEFQLLKILCENKGNVVGAEELFHALWKDEYYSKSNNTITVHIRHLREKLKDTGEKPKYIKTVWGVGYKIDA